LKTFSLEKLALSAGKQSHGGSNLRSKKIFTQGKTILRSNGYGDEALNRKFNLV
jgi:hypothetical protein